ncbi:MAG: helix-turn-helix domain-containing protein [Candidatus Binatia bacterium]
MIGEKEDSLLNSRQAAEILNLSPDTVNELARKQALPGMKRGRQWRFRRRDVVFLKRQMQEQVAA